MLALNVLENLLLRLLNAWSSRRAGGISKVAKIGVLIQGSALMAVGLVELIASLLAPAEVYGSYSYARQLVLVAAVLCALGIDSAVVRERDARELGQSWFRVLIPIHSCAALVAVVAWLIAAETQGGRASVTIAIGAGLATASTLLASYERSIGMYLSLIHI